MAETHRRDRAATRARLLDVARRRFARLGYDATSVRDIAGDAGVDAALVFRYFGSKRTLFDEATTATDAPTDLLDGPPEELPARLLEAVVFADFSAYGGENPLVAMLRSSGHEETRDRLREEVCATYVRALADIADGPDHELRAELFSAWMVGIGVLRSVVGTPELSKATTAEVGPHLAAVATALLGRQAAPTPRG